MMDTEDFPPHVLTWVVTQLPLYQCLEDTDDIFYHENCFHVRKCSIQVFRVIQALVIVFDTTNSQILASSQQSTDKHPAKIIEKE